MSNFCIAIPTKNRSKQVCKTIDSLISSNLGQTYDVIIVDNASNDKTFEVIKDKFSSINGLSFFREEGEYDFLGSITRLISHCNHKYVMILSDEDGVNLTELPSLMNFLSQVNPGFVSTNVLNNSLMLRGRSETKRMKVQEAHAASFYISGLIFKTGIAKQAILAIFNAVDSNEYLSLYPQAGLAAAVILEDSGYWYSGNLITCGDSLPTLVTSADGSPYRFPNSRILQIVGQQEFFAFLIATYKDKFTKAAELQLKYMAIRRTYPDLMQSVNELDPNFSRIILKSAFYASLMSIPRAIKRRAL